MAGPRSLCYDPKRPSGAPLAPGLRLPDSAAALLERARLGDERALSELFHQHEPRLLRMVELRLDPALRARMDPSDVLQDVWVEAARRFGEWCQQDALALHVWLRLLTSQALAQAQRRHLGAHMRDALREARAREGRAGLCTRSTADALVASATSPTQAVQREELRQRVLAALEELDEIDREIVALRHLEGLSNEEAAAELAIEPKTASKRFMRALARLRPALRAIEPGRSTEGP